MLFRVIFFLFFVLTLRPPSAARGVTDPVLEGTIERLFHTVFFVDDESKEALARSEVKKIYAEQGLPTITEVGDQPAYEFVILLMSDQFPLAFRTAVVAKVNEGAARHELPLDAATFCAAKLRVEKAKAEEEARPLSNPALRDEIERMYKADQAVREQQGFDPRKLEQTDRRDAAPLQAILNKHGVPTYAMVGPEAAGEFVIMIQHQPARFRQQVLPKLKANVDAGQADPESYALVYDRSQRDRGKKQLYGEQFECNQGEKLHIAPIEDEARVNQRRAELGLVRIEFYERMLAETMPQFCPSAVKR
jgi:hypothetical protein